GKGYATEAGKACLDYGFGPLGLKRIIGRADVANLASIRVLKKLGMTFYKEDGLDGSPAYIYHIVKH
ncbi:UNVERIFIED_CONTAM: GNAT family N-acetyltransferase, partial [Salmonella enterica subsp. enterica serovar Weltevreden]